MEEQMADLLADSDERVQKVAAEQLLAAGPETLGILVKSLDNPKRDARVWAAVVLGELGPAARPAVGALRGALGEVAPKHRPIFQTALRKIMP
jgi:HEAT repeat protein